MIISSEFRMGQYSDDGHREDALHFIIWIITFCIFRLELFASFYSACISRLLLQSSTTISNRVKSIRKKKLILTLSMFSKICLKLTMSGWIYTIECENHHLIKKIIYEAEIPSRSSGIYKSADSLHFVFQSVQLRVVHGFLVQIFHQNWILAATCYNEGLISLW